MKFTEGAFRDWGYQLSVDEFGGEPLDGGPWHVIKNPNNGNNIVIKDVICDAFLQQILTRPKEYDVIATMNLNGDYISDALAACVGGPQAQTLVIHVRFLKQLMEPHQNMLVKIR